MKLFLILGLAAALASGCGDDDAPDDGGMDDGSVDATFRPTDPGDRDFRIIFELVDDQVVRYRSGRIGVIERSLADC